MRGIQNRYSQWKCLKAHGNDFPVTRKRFNGLSCYFTFVTIFAFKSGINWFTQRDLQNILGLPLKSWCLLGVWLHWKVYLIHQEEAHCNLSYPLLLLLMLVYNHSRDLIQSTVLLLYNRQSTLLFSFGWPLWAHRTNTVGLGWPFDLDMLFWGSPAISVSSPGSIPSDAVLQKVRVSRTNSDIKLFFPFFPPHLLCYLPPIQT